VQSNHSYAIRVSEYAVPICKIVQSKKGKIVKLVVSCFQILRPNAPNLISAKNSSTPCWRSLHHSFTLPYWI